jgi:hypothetical protein
LFLVDADLRDGVEHSTSNINTWRVASPMVIFSTNLIFLQLLRLVLLQKLKAGSDSLITLGVPP